MISGVYPRKKAGAQAAYVPDLTFWQGGSGKDLVRVSCPMGAINSMSDTQ